jgi:hypothetical protein
LFAERGVHPALAVADWGLSRTSTAAEETAGIGALRDRTSKPDRQLLKTSRCWEEQILELRAERLTVQRIAHSPGLPKSTVARVLSRHGQSRLPPLHPPPPVVRHEWKQPGELLHLDVKKLARVRGNCHRITGVSGSLEPGIASEYVHVCIDDCTRLAYVEVLHDEKGVTAAAFLRRALAWTWSGASRCAG